MGEGPQRPQQVSRPAPPSRRSRVLAITAGVLLVMFLMLSGFAGFWTERLWFESVGYEGVFTTLLWTRIGLFLAFGGLMAATVATSIAFAYRFRPVLWPSMPGMPDDGLDRYRSVIAPRVGWMVATISLLMGAFAGVSASGQWRSYSLWRHSESFGQQDPYFSKDVGFYVFDLPWWHYITDFVMALAVIGLMATIVVNYLFGGIRLSAPAGERLSRPAAVQISLLLAVFVIAKAVDYWIDRYDLVVGGGGLFTGMGYTDDKAVLPAKEILTGIAIVCALLFLANIWRRTWMLPSLGVALFALSAVVLGLIVPGVVQLVQVNPDVPGREGAYLDKNIAATRQAFQLDKIEEERFSGTPVDGDGQLRALDDITSSVPLVDPKIVSQTFQLQQQVRPYYAVGDVLDVDRYELDGKQRAIVLGVRELDQSGIAADNQTWANMHTIYTHGNGVIAAYANQRPADDEDQSTAVQWAEGQEANQDALSTLNPEGYESRVYYGEMSPSYSIVGSSPGADPVELDLAMGAGTGDEGEDRDTTYTGSGGVPVGNLFTKVLYAVKYSDPNLVLSPRVHADSKILYNRNPREMVEKVAPWLTVDSDPYPAVIDGRIQWILDGYTTTDQFPLSQRESLETMTDDSLQESTGFETLPTDEVNYLRNSVKATVDAYDGTVTLYEWDESDPILKVWARVFPDVVKPRADIPDELLSHLRYPEDLFKAQRYQYQRYHVTDSRSFLEGSERWEAPKDPQDTDKLQPPYRLFTDEDGNQTWSLTSVYVWPKRDKLASFMEVDSDATSQTYGKISVKELPDEGTDGPRLIANQLSTNDEVRDRLLPYTNGDADIINGNLLTLPVGEDFMYVQPLYTRRKNESAFPVLTFALVSYKGNVGIGTTLLEAIGDALDVDPDSTETPSSGETEEPTESPSGSPSASPTDEPSTSPGVRGQMRELLREADAAFTAADEAQREGNTVKWARQMEKARRLIEEAVLLSER